MDALTLLRELATRADGVMTQVFADVTAEQAAWRLAGSIANAIGPTFFHVYYGEDRTVHELIQGKPSIFVSGGWWERLEVDPANVWAPDARPDPAALRAYATAVHAATQAILPTLDEATLARELDTPRGRQTVLTRLSLLLVTHKCGHMGEIAALLGCQGAKGFPI